ncbi:phage tail protein [Hymenobacter psychrophilus]|uniref:Microcystin-dependent protein n=1 Tax=Hymenobacter psychrophilus TaxID=651662 RepID=A0A1H3HYU5_9BACT|nr:tail fiber protein [Hymenobacter psychrophilus]SDY20641.1 Microcystin-dependent protein [Hymenobacter psychrophilus]
MSTLSIAASPSLPVRRSLLKRLSGLVAGSFLAGPLQALLGRATPAAAGTLTGGSDPFVAEIVMFPFNFVPKGYARCNGQLLPISQNTALFALLGTIYGGDGRSTFALPNLNGRVAIGAGQGPGLSLYDLGQTGGSATTTLNETELPVHQHTLALTYSSELGTLGSPEGAYLASNGSGEPQYEASGAGYMATGTIGNAEPHNNMQPYLGLSYCIALQGVFPPRW